MTDRDSDAIGLCASCRWTHRVTNRRGSTFFRCGRADSDARFSRYPALPMVACAGYQRSDEEEPEPGAPVEHG